MAQDMGEFAVGAYLKFVLACDFVEYGVRPPVGGKEGQGEFDVVGLDFRSNPAYLCEVATHIRGLNYNGNKKTVLKIREKHARQRNYAERYLSKFDSLRFMLWSPYVPRGYLTENLSKIEGLELIINGLYKECIDEIRMRARAETKESTEPFFRVLQILEHMKEGMSRSMLKS